MPPKRPRKKPLQTVEERDVRLRLGFTPNEFDRMREFARRDGFGDDVAYWIVWRIRRIIQPEQPPE